MNPLHSRIDLFSFIPSSYFSPPSLPERPVVKVIAFFEGIEYFLEETPMGKIGN